jgi:hypothetical protein
MFFGGQMFLKNVFGGQMIFKKCNEKYFSGPWSERGVERVSGDHVVRRSNEKGFGDHVIGTEVLKFLFRDHVVRIRGDGKSL